MEGGSERGSGTTHLAPSIHMATALCIVNLDMISEKLILQYYFGFYLPYFSLSGLGLTLIPAELLQQLPNLEDIDLSKNKLTAIGHERSLPQLKVVSFASNQLINVEGLTAFPNLESLDVTNNPTLEVIRSIRIYYIFLECSKP